MFTEKKHWTEKNVETFHKNVEIHSLSQSNGRDLSYFSQSVVAVLLCKTSEKYRQDCVYLNKIVLTV